MRQKVKYTLEQAMRAELGSSASSLTSALVRGGWWTPRVVRFTPGKETRYPLYRRLGGPQARSGRVRKKSPPPPAFDCRTVQPVASRDIDWAVPAHTNKTYREQMLHAPSVLYVMVPVALVERDRLRAVLFVEYIFDAQYK